MINNVIPIKKLVGALSLFLGILCCNDAHALTWKTPPDAFLPIGRSSLDFASDPVGNAFTVWVDTTTGEAYSTRFAAVTGTYGIPTLLYPQSETIRVAADATQTALFVFTDPNLIDSQLRTAYFNGTTYVTPTPSPLRTTTAGVEIFPAVAMDGLGNGVTAWSEGDTENIFSSFFDSGTGSWGPITQLNALGTFGLNPDVAYSADGTAAAIWRDTSTLEVRASNFNGTTWSAVPVAIGTPFSINYQLQMDASGNALALWTNLAGDILYFNYYSGGTWSTETQLSLIDFESYSFQMSPNGNAVVGFIMDGEAYYSYFTGGSWSVPVQYSVNAAGLATNLAVAIDTAGNALLTWLDDNTNNAWSRLLTAGVLQPTADFVATADQLVPVFAGLADNGRGFVTGFIPIDEDSGVSATYTLFVAPGLVATGTTCNNKFATQTDRVHIISFTPSIDPSVLAYYIRRNGELIAAIPASGPYIYYDHNRCKRVTDVYTITAVSLEGEGASAVVILR